VLAIGALLGWLSASGRLATIAYAQDLATKAQSPGGTDELPRPEQPFKGKIGRTAKESTPDFPKGKFSQKKFETECLAEYARTFRPVSKGATRPNDPM
jgi:hypothetical protein